MDQRLTDVTYADHFQSLVEIIGQGTINSIPLATEEDAADRGSRLFEDPGLTILRDMLCQTIGLSEAEALWLLTAKLKKPVTKWAQIPLEKINSLVDSLSASDPGAIQSFVKQNKKGA